MIKDKLRILMYILDGRLKIHKDKDSKINIDGLRLMGDAQIDIKCTNGSSIYIGRGTMIFGKRVNIEANDISIIHIGHGCQIHSDVNITARKKIKIGNECLMAKYVYILDSDHAIKEGVIQPNKFIEKEVFIGDNVWIGTKATILKGSLIPNYCVVGANSLINKEFNTFYTLIAGTPAIEKKHNNI